ncbi:MAG: sulfatase-like hydrolase/transferase [Gloeobacteraceae cyanobacterium ES-bin-144]|nr:sulfatase-like hydrolase/transferase [Verrucomicrobiales bacterium]
MQKIQLLFTLLLAPLAMGAPITSSWFTELSGQYARIYPTTADETANAAVTTWDHPTGNDQLSPTYSGVSEISTTATDPYIRTSGLPFHTMGPWYLNAYKTTLFPNYPGNIAQFARIPLTPVIAAMPKNQTAGGAIGYFVDGVAMFDSRDGFSYINSTAVDANSPTNRGDGNWNRDAFVNEGITFDPAYAHQAGNLHHYHANPAGLRYLLGDSVTYNATTNRYTETPNGTHSPILAWTFDGFPLYGPYGYSSPLNPASGVRRMISGYQMRNGTNGSANLTTTGCQSLPAWLPRNESSRTNPLAANQYGPPVNATYTLGHYLEDYDYKGDLGLTLGIDFDLNEYNVRWCVTPEFPAGTWAYFCCIDPASVPVFPYNISRYYYGTKQGANVNTLPSNREILFQGGPEATQKMDPPTVAAATGNVTLTWSGVEGGTYRIERSDNLTSWKLLDDSATTNAGSFGTKVDPSRATSAPKQFYRSSLTSIKTFDSAGFDYTAPAQPTFTATFASLPALANITGVTVGGVVATIVGSSGNSLDLTFTTTSLASGNFTATITHTGGSTISTNFYTVPPLRNILLLIVDDWGIDSSPIDNNATLNPGAAFTPMPNIEALAARGLRFTNAYAEPVCSPTRASILTGRHPFRHGVGHPNGTGTLPTSELTLPEIFTSRAPIYQLASFGKWHLGGGANGPFANGGWPEFRGILSGAVMNYYSWSKTINGITNPTNVTTYTTTDQVNDAISYINSHSSAPWFVWMGFNAPHDPFHNPPSSLQSYPAYPVDANGEITNPANRRSAYQAALQALDTEIGRLLANVDPATTDIILLGDNGTPGQVIQTPFSGTHGKDTLYQGGVHVPFVIAGPSVPVCGTSSRFVHCVDLFSTILDLAHINVATATASVSAIDSTSLLPVLKGQDTASRSVVSERFGSGLTGDGRALISADFPDYKLIAFGDPTITTDVTTYQMFDIATDPNELSPLTLPPATTVSYYSAYQALVAKDAALFPPAAAAVTLYLQLPTTPAGAAGVPTNAATVPTSIVVNGSTTATYVARFNTSNVYNQYWVKCTVPGTLSPPYSSAVVTFPNNPNTGDTRVFNAIGITVGP